MEHIATLTEGPALPSSRACHAGGIVSGHVIVAGGSAWNADRSVKQWLSDTLIFSDGAWHNGPPLPHPIVESAFADDGKDLYVIGGWRGPEIPSQSTYRLSLNGEMSITPLKEFPLNHSSGACAVLGGQLYVFGGHADGQLTSQLWALDLRSDDASWARRASLPATPRAYSAMTRCGGFLYLFGGLAFDAAGAMHTFNDVFQYDPAANAWREIGELPARGYGWNAASVDDERVILGGRADGAIHDDLWLVELNRLTTRSIGRSVVPTTAAPLICVHPKTYWLIGGEPDANRSRTERITQIHLKHS